MMLWRYLYRHIFHFTRLRSFRELTIIIGTFMCITLYLTTYLFDASTLTHQRIVFNNGFPWNFPQSARSILSQFGSPNNYYPNGTAKWRFNTLGGVSSFRDSSVDQSTLMKRIVKLLREIEESTLPQSKKSKLALIRGQRSVISRDFPLYRWALEKHKFAIDAPNWLRSKRRVSTLTAQNMTEATDWLILICLAYTDGDTGICLERKDFQKLKSFQRVNRIPGLRNLLWRKDSFCSAMNEARKITSLMKNPVTPLCFVMPVQYQQFVDVSDALGYSVEWLLKPMTVGGRLSGSGPQRVNIFTNEGRSNLREYNAKRAVVQQYITKPLLVYGQPVNLRIYVVISSIAPLRAFVHSEGLVFHRYDEDKSYKKILGRTWMLSQFWQFVSKNFGSEKTINAVKNIHRAILQTLLVAEAMLVTQYQQSQYQSNSINPADHVRRCTSCFHLIGFDVMLNSTLDPWIIEVNGQPNMQENSKDESPLSGKVKKYIIDDLISLISSTNSVADDVAEALEEIVDDNIGVMGFNCHISHDLCLSNDDLIYLLQSRREALNKGGFKQLYPSLGTENMKQLIDELSQTISIRAGQSNDLSMHRTADLHSLLMSLERFYYRHIIDEEFGDAAGNTHDHNSNLHNGSFISFTKSFSHSSSSECSDEPLTLPYIASIDLIPKLQLYPSFSPYVTQYYANASYDQLLVTVSASAQNCQSEVRLDDKFGSSRSTNYTLGVGNNKITFVVVDISHTEPWVINTYTLIINRHSITHNEPYFNNSLPHEVCSLIQDCDMRVYPRNSCGLFKEKHISDWRMYLYRQSLTPICSNGWSFGRWVLPCNKCQEKSSCYWREAKWDPINCHYNVLSKKAISKCVSNKKILFIGDSTNRGIMHYLIEKMNGTLMEWDKTHDLKIYPNLNNGRTHLSFAYYPKFWLPSNQRPSFEKALYQLFEKVQPIENNSNTILVFGGVQWLASQHIHMLFKALSNMQLQGIKLIMKTLGAGFHQPIEGVHCLSLDELQKLALHNTALANHAHKLGIEVIDTYNITISRYKDYLPGKCACHFHTISEFGINDSNSRVSQQNHYHVEGPINAIYTDILISRICNGFGDHTKR